MGLEGVIGYVKKAAVATTLAASMLVPSQSLADKLSIDYSVFSRDITNPNLSMRGQSQLIGSYSEGNIRPTGNFSDEIAPRYAEEGQCEKRVTESGEHALNITIDTNTQDTIYFSYNLLVKDCPDIDIPRGLREDIPNIHIYAVLPKGASIRGAAQRLQSTDTMYWSSHGGDPVALPAEELGVTEEMMKSLGQYTLEDVTDEIIGRIPGKAGLTIKAIKAGIKFKLAKEEERRLEELAEQFGDDYQVFKMPFYQVYGTPLKGNIIGRKTGLALETNFDGTRKGYIIIPNISFSEDVQGLKRIASLEDLSYEFDIQGSKTRKELEEEKQGKEIEPKNETIYDTWIAERMRGDQWQGIEVGISPTELSWREYRFAEGERVSPRPPSVSKIKGVEKAVTTHGLDLEGNLTYSTMNLVSNNIALFKIGEDDEEIILRRDSADLQPSTLEDIEGTWKAGPTTVLFNEEGMLVKNGPDSQEFKATHVSRIDDAFFVSLDMDNDGEADGDNTYILLEDGTLVMGVGSKVERRLTKKGLVDSTIDSAIEYLDNWLAE